jgi:hypothetical protein
VTSALSIVGFVAALIVLVAQIMIANQWTEGDLSKLLP